MKAAAKQLPFEGVFLDDSECKALFDQREEADAAPVGMITGEPIKGFESAAASKEDE